MTLPLLVMRHYPVVFRCPNPSCPPDTLGRQRRSKRTRDAQRRKCRTCQRVIKILPLSVQVLDNGADKSRPLLWPQWEQLRQAG